jgi:hypothetical protein
LMQQSRFYRASNVHEALFSKGLPLFKRPFDPKS